MDTTQVEDQYFEVPAANGTHPADTGVPSTTEISTTVSTTLPSRTSTESLMKIVYGYTVPPVLGSATYALSEGDQPETKVIPASDTQSEHSMQIKFAFKEPEIKTSARDKSTLVVDNIPMQIIFPHTESPMQQTTEILHQKNQPPILIVVSPETGSISTERSKPANPFTDYPVNPPNPIKHYFNFDVHNESSNEMTKADKITKPIFRPTPMLPFEDTPIQTLSTSKTTPSTITPIHVPTLQKVSDVFGSVFNSTANSISPATLMEVPTTTELIPSSPRFFQDIKPIKMLTENYNTSTTEVLISTIQSEPKITKSDSTLAVNDLQTSRGSGLNFSEPKNLSDISTPEVEDLETGIDKTSLGSGLKFFETISNFFLRNPETDVALTNGNEKLRFKVTRDKVVDFIGLFNGIKFERK